MLHNDLSILIQNTIDKLQEPMRSFAYLGLLIGIPLLLIGLVWLCNKIENKKEK